MKKDFYLVERIDNSLFIICESDNFDYLLNLQNAYKRKNKTTFIFEWLQ